MDRVQLYRRMTRSFSESDLKTICFFVYIDYEMLPGKTKGEKVRELIIHCEQMDCMLDLISVCSEERPLVFQEDLGAQIVF